jgi:hypothetical protein
MNETREAIAEEVKRLPAFIVYSAGGMHEHASGQWVFLPDVLKVIRQTAEPLSFRRSVTNPGAE